MIYNRNNLVAWAVMTGAVGDGLLQLLVQKNVGDWGLKEYFAQHGHGEAICVAAGMMGLFYIIYLYMLPFLPVNLIGLALFGIVIDLLFRWWRIFPSLDGYYRSLNYFESAVWAAIPMMLPYMLATWIRW